MKSLNNSLIDGNEPGTEIGQDVVLKPFVKAGKLVNNELNKLALLWVILPDVISLLVETYSELYSLGLAEGTVDSLGARTPPRRFLQWDSAIYKIEDNF